VRASFFEVSIVKFCADHQGKGMLQGSVGYLKLQSSFALWSLELEG